MIRAAVLQDIDGILGLAMEQAKRYSFVRPDREKMRKVLTAAISAGKHFCWVSSREGKVEGALVALVSENLWARNMHASMALWVSGVPGDGARMLRKFRDWVRERPGIVAAGMSPDLNLDHRILQLAERIGFTKTGGAYLLTRG
jgi:hypothetical protein